MWSPVKMVYNSKLDEPSMQARKPDHHASLRRHRTHTVVRSHQYDTLASADACPVFFVVTPLAAKTICPWGNCSRMAFWYLFPRVARVRTLTYVRVLFLFCSAYAYAYVRIRWFTCASIDHTRQLACARSLG